MARNQDGSLLATPSSIFSWRERRWPNNEEERFRFSREHGFAKAAQLAKCGTPVHAGSVKPQPSEECQLLLDDLDEQGFVSRTVPDFDPFPCACCVPSFVIRLRVLFMLMLASATKNKAFRSAM
eukprot:SAG31_NODE_2640_length_5324_cov_5.437835_7_plen_124_part_00